MVHDKSVYIRNLSGWMKGRLAKVRGLNYVELAYGSVSSTHIVREEGDVLGSMKVAFTIKNRPSCMLGIQDWQATEQNVAINFGFDKERIGTSESNALRNPRRSLPGYSLRTSFTEPSLQLMGEYSETKERALDGMVSRIRDFDGWYGEAMEGYKRILDDCCSSMKHHTDNVRKAAMPREDLNG
ncbi:MAG: hypothetical protein NT016_03465 [Candidatus Aenigmarchaeota archaeon]|nr:hypothetical protein [Candidatus Aenigmarchaeota archaeon]